MLPERNWATSGWGTMINFSSQLKHRDDQIINPCCVRDMGWIWRGTAMSAFKREPVLSGGFVLPRRRLQEAPALAPGLRYSSARPWVLALAISSAMWVGIGWLIWK